MSQPRNQRISSGRQRKQQHLLDVKIRVGKERERRVRVVAGFIFKMLFLGALFAGLWIGGHEAWRRFVWENPDYFIRDPEVKTDGTLTREQILTTAEIVEGRNIFTVDLSKSRAALEKLPQVESAEVLRTFPNRVSISITERRPIAWLTQRKDDDAMTSERSFLIDGRGIVLRSRVLLPEYYLLPVISGVETENLVPGQRASHFEIQSALELVRLNAESTRFQVRHIDLSLGYGMLVANQRRAQVTFGFRNVEDQLDRLYALLDAVERSHRELRTANLIPVRNIPTTTFDPAEEIVAPPTVAESPTITPPGARAATPKPDAKGPKSRAATPAPTPVASRATTRNSRGRATTNPTRNTAPKATPAPAHTPPSNPLQKRFDLNG